MRTPSRTLATIGAAGIVVGALVASPVPAIAAGSAPMVIDSTSYAHLSRAPRLPSSAVDLGTVKPGSRLSGAVALKPRDPGALTRAATAVSNPRSPSYHHYIAKGSFKAMYGPTPTTIDAVESTLRASKLTVTSVSGNGLLVHFSGTVGAAESAFRTHLATFRLAGGRTGTETTEPLSFPASIATQVSAVIGLDTLVKASANVRHATHPAGINPVTHAIQPAVGAAAPCPDATGDAIDNGGLTDDQIAHAYGVDGLYDAGDLGAGQTVAIYELEPFAARDVTVFDACYFGASKAVQMAGRLHTITVDGGGGAGSGSGESVLDIEDVSAIAPEATIDVYEAPNTTAGGMDEYNAMVAADTAQIVTSSWGFCELDEANLQPGYANVENDVFQQAALQGQTVLNSTGDSGSDECAYNSPEPVAPTISQDDPASQPFVLGVGGTTITDAADPPTETVWNDGPTGGGGGGGPSAVWGAPSWQQAFIKGADKDAAAAAVTDGLVPCQQSADASLCRETPDVSAQADEFTGAITIYTAQFGGWTTEGGTSSSAPLWAAMLAEVNASAACQSAGPLGFVAPSLYAVATNHYAASFNDVIEGNNDVYDLFNGDAFAAASGFDMATGLGTPKVTGPGGSAGLAAYLCVLGAPATPRPVITSVSRPTLASTPSGSLTVTGTGFAAAKGVSIDAYAVPAANWTATGGTTIVISPIPTAAQVGTASFGPQDGTGRAIVSVTGATGTTSLPNAASILLYVAGTSGSPIPSVEGIAAYGGRQAGGNTVSVFGSDFTTSGPDAITAVTVGGVNVESFTAVNDSTLSVVIPAYESGTTVCAAGDDPVSDVCQAQVVVSNANGSSATATISRPYRGQPFLGFRGGLPLPSCVVDKSCEIVSAISEYDYLPTPTITSVRTTSKGDPITWVSETGDSIATVRGTGFDYLGFEWATIGSAGLASHHDFFLLDITPKKFEIVLNGRNLSRVPVVTSLTAQTLGGRSAPWPMTYAGVPEITAVTPSAGADTGGTHIALSGKGLEGAAVADGGDISFNSLTTTATADVVSHYSVSSDTALRVIAPKSDPAAFTVEVCTITLCSAPTSNASAIASLFDAYQPRDPKLTSVTVRSGPASGGTRVVVHGHGLADAVKVSFGGSVSEATTAPQVLANGTSTTVDAIAPPGKAGSTVSIRVETVESLVTGDGASAPSAAATFTYRSSVASRPRHVSATKHGTSLTVRWAVPISDGGHAIRHYRVKAVAVVGSNSMSSHTPHAVVVVTRHGGARSAKVAGLGVGWSYTVEVQAVTSKGRGLVAAPLKSYAITGSV